MQDIRGIFFAKENDSKRRLLRILIVSSPSNGLTESPLGEDGRGHTLGTSKQLLTLPPYKEQNQRSQPEPLKQEV